MRTSMKVLAALLTGTSLFAPSLAISAEKAPKAALLEKSAAEPTTRNDAVIFKVHDITPVSEEGVVTGCDFIVTLYNRTAINFRTFTINLQWKDAVDERFKFNRYVESVLGADEAAKQKDFLGEDTSAQPLRTSVTVNAFGADKQISVRSHVNNEKCYLMLNPADYAVTPCEIARSIDSAGGLSVGAEGKECTNLFQLVDTKNPEYFGQFKNISATEIAEQNKKIESKELADIDVVIGKIVENLGTSDETLANIN